MLVKESIVNQWYSRKHWMFQQFSFLFQNPWWQKRVPSGFSVCPYFWASMLSFFLLRPAILLVTAIHNIFLKPLGKPLAVFEQWVQSWFVKEPTERNAPPGLTSVTLAVVAAAVSMLGILLVKLGGLIATAISVNPLLIPVLILVAIGIVMTGFIIRYKVVTRTLDANCKVNYYYVVWALAVMIAIGISSGAGPFGFFVALWTNLVVQPAAFCWWVVVDGITTLGSWIATAAVFCWKMLVAFVSYKVSGVYWWLYLAGLLIGGTVIGNWLLNQAFLSNVENFHPAMEGATTNDQEKRRNRSAWRYVIWKGLTEKVGSWSTLERVFRDELRAALLTVPDAGFNRPSEAKYDGTPWWEHTVALSQYWYYWKARMLDVVFAPLLDKLQDQRCPVRYEWHTNALDFDTNNASNDLVADVATVLNRHYGTGIDYSERRELKTVLGVIAHRKDVADDYKAGLESAQREIAIQAQEAREAEKKRANPRRSLLEVLFGSKERANELCAKTTASIAAPFIACWLVLKRVYVEVKTFVAWAWIYAKSKKQGACPFITFKD